MTWVPGQSGNPNGAPAGDGKRRRDRYNQAVFDEIKKRGWQSPLLTLAELSNTCPDFGIRGSAAASLSPYMHPKMQSIPTPRYIEDPIEIPEFTTVEQATAFLAKIDSLAANSKLDLQSALELVTITKAFIDSKVASDLEARVAALEFHLTHPDEPQEPGE